MATTLHVRPGCPRSERFEALVRLSGANVEIRPVIGSRLQRRLRRRCGDWTLPLLVRRNITWVDRWDIASMILGTADARDRWMGLPGDERDRTRETVRIAEELEHDLCCWAALDAAPERAWELLPLGPMPPFGRARAVRSYLANQGIYPAGAGRLRGRLYERVETLLQRRGETPPDREDWGSITVGILLRRTSIPETPEALRRLAGPLTASSAAHA